MNNNRSTIRTIEILRLIAGCQHQLTITEISQTLNIPKSTTHQILQTLVELGVLEYSKYRTYRLGIHFFEIALPAFANMDLRKEASPILEDLSSQTGRNGLYGHPRQRGDCLPRPGHGTFALEA